MIKQQLCRKSATGFQTLAVSSALRESAWMSLLEQPSPYEDAPGENAYFQYPLGTGLVIGRSVRTGDGAYLIRRLVIDENADLDALRLARPLSAALLSAQPDTDGATALPTLSPAALFDASLPGEGFRLIDSLFDEGLLARFIKALLAAASDKRLSVHAVINQPPDTVSAQARLMMETFMRCLPLRDGLRLSWHTLIEDGVPSAPYSVFFSPPCADHGCIRFDLSRGTVIWPDEPPADDKSLTLARALLAHDLNWADRADESGAGALRSSPALHMDTPPFERGMSLAQYVQDWADALDVRRAILNEDAFKTLARGEWPHLINSVINAADLLPRRDFTLQLNDCLSALSHGRGAELGMTGEHLCDLAAILVDSIDWDEADLNDPQTVRLLRSATEYAALLDAERCPEGRLAACRAPERHDRRSARTERKQPRSAFAAASLRPARRNRTLPKSAERIGRICADRRILRRAGHHGLCALLARRSRSARAGQTARPDRAQRRRAGGSPLQRPAGSHAQAHEHVPLRRSGAEA